MASATPNFKRANVGLLIPNARNKVWGAFLRACRVLRFPGNIQEAFSIAASPYDAPSRSYHDWAHGSLMTVVPEREILKLRTALRLEPEEEKKIVALLTYSGLFHDIAYEQVDGGLEKRLKAIVENYVVLSEGAPWRATLREDIDVSPVGRIVRTMFGLQRGQTVADVSAPDDPSLLPVMNEFLSALAAAHLLAGDKTPDTEMVKRIAAVAAIIEGTVPFRPQKAFKDMFDRLRSFNFSEREAEITVKAAVMLANRDVQAFCGGPIETAQTLTKEQRFHAFVAGTWQLMPENNMNLRGNNYLPSEYLASLRKSHSFLLTIIKVRPDQIFHSFRGFPEEKEMKLRQEYAEQNLKLLDEYLSAKIASASIVEAIAKAIGSKKSLREIMTGVQERLPPPINKFQGDDLIVYNTLLDRGAEVPRGFDTKQSPIARYIMQTHGKEAIDRIVAAADKHMPLNNPQAADCHAFLKEIVSDKSYGPEIMGEILCSMKEVDAEKLDELETSLGLAPRGDPAFRARSPSYPI